MNLTSIPNQERLTIWKNLRTSLQDMTLDEQLNKIVEFGKTIPFGTRTIDYYTPDSWPTPWDILFYNSYCVSSISLLMYYTLVMAAPKTQIQIYLIEDKTGQYLVPVIDKQWVINYELGNITDISYVKDNAKILKVFEQSHIKQIN